MGLRSLPLLILLAVLTALLLAGVLRCWAVHGRHWGAGQALRRVGLLGALQISVLSLIFVWVNRSQEFYASWSDLLGTSAVTGRVVALSEAESVPAGQPALVLPGAAAGAGHGTTGGPHGLLEEVRLRGGASGLSARGYVFLPPGYSRTGRRLPVVLVLSREAGSRTAADGARQLAAAAGAGMAAGRLAHLILVLLPPAVAGRADPGCLDIPGGPQATMFFTQDLPQAVETSFRASRLPAQWAVVGGPGGGYCALQLATSAAGIFSVAAAPAGAYLAPPGPRVRTTVWLRSEQNLQWRLRHRPAPPVRVLFTARPGTAGGLMALVRPPMTAAMTSTVPGRQPLMPVLTWVGRAVGGR